VVVPYWAAIENIFFFLVFWFIFLEINLKFDYLNIYIYI
jgi:hypothetical protein